MVQVYNSNQLEHGGSTVSWLGYLATGDFVEATFENWESEFLQMGAYVVLTVYLLQRGSSALISVCVFSSVSFHWPAFRRRSAMVRQV